MAVEDIPVAPEESVVEVVVVVEQRETVEGTAHLEQGQREVQLKRAAQSLLSPHLFPSSLKQRCKMKS